MSTIPKNKKKGPKENGKKKLDIEEIEVVLKDKKEELLRLTQKKLFLEKRLSDKNIEIESFRKKYKELQNHIHSIDEQCNNKYTEHLQEEKNTIHRKSLLYNYQNAQEMQKLETEKNELKMLINQKHEETMKNLMSGIEEQRLDLETIKNKNFHEITQLNESFNLKVKEMENIFTTYLHQFENEKQEEIKEVLENYTIMEHNEITFLKNLYSDHIKEINDSYETLLQDLKKYYIDLIKENINKIKQLKMKIQELDTNDKEVKNELMLLHNESLSLSDEIQNLELKRENMKKNLKFYSKDFVLHKNLELIYNESSIHIKNLKIISSSMKEQINEIENELVRLSGEINVTDYFEHIQKKNCLLKEKVKELNLNLEDIHEQLNSYLNKHNVREEDIAKVKTGTEYAIKTLNNEYDNLRYVEKKIKKKMKENINIYEKKLKDLNIQKND